MSHLSFDCWVPLQQVARLPFQSFLDVFRIFVPSPRGSLKPADLWLDFHLNTPRSLLQKLWFLENHSRSVFINLSIVELYWTRSQTIFHHQKTHFFTPKKRHLQTKIQAIPALTLEWWIWSTKSNSQFQGFSGSGSTADSQDFSSAAERTTRVIEAWPKAQAPVGP